MKKFLFSTISLFLLVVILIIYFRNVVTFWFFNYDLNIPLIWDMPIETLIIILISLSFFLGVFSVFTFKAFTSKQNIDDDFEL